MPYPIRARHKIYLYCLFLGLVTCDKLLYRCCKSCKALYLGGNDYLGSLAVGSLCKGFKALDSDNVLGGVCFIELSDSIGKSLLNVSDGLSFTLCFKYLLLSYSVGTEYHSLLLSLGLEDSSLLVGFGTEDL